MSKPNPPKPDPTNPDDKAWGGDRNEGQCTSCGGSGRAMINGKPSDCPTCGGSGKR